MQREVLNNSSERALDIALEALERIAQHEKECGVRWAEVAVELRELKKSTNDHSARWERLAWLVVGTSVTCMVTIASMVVG
jgi:hypothetical protein